MTDDLSQAAIDAGAAVLHAYAYNPKWCAPAARAAREVLLAASEIIDCGWCKGTGRAGTLQAVDCPDCGGTGRIRIIR